MHEQEEDEMQPEEEVSSKLVCVRGIGVRCGSVISEAAKQEQQCKNTCHVICQPAKKQQS